MDLTTDDCRIPFYNNQIFVKATRISWSRGFFFGKMSQKLRFLLILFQENEEPTVAQQQQPVFENNFGGPNQYSNFMEFKDFKQPGNNSPQKPEKQKKENNLLDF